LTALISSLKSSPDYSGTKQKVLIFHVEMGGQSSSEEAILPLFRNPKGRVYLNHKMLVRA